MLNKVEQEIHEMAKDPKLAEAVIEAIGEKGAINLSHRDGEGNTLLAIAARAGNLPLARFLVQRCGQSLLEGNYDGATPLDGATKEIREALAAESRHYGRNPVLRGFHPDPSVVKVGRDYYLANSSFVYFPAIPISHSRDLVHWQTIGYALVDAKDAHLDGLSGGRGYWAADLSYDGEYFYVAATLRGNEGSEKPRVQMVLRSKKPQGPYGAPSWIDVDGIDPSLFHHEGKHYMLLNRGCRIIQLDENCAKKVSRPKMLWYGSGCRTPEGPHMLFHDGYFYIFLAEGGTGGGHQETCARSRTLEGPYESCPHNPILKARDEEGYLSCCGHGHPVEGPDGCWYFFFLGVRRGSSPYHPLGRETCLTPMHWDKEGWPVLDYPRTLVPISFEEEKASPKLPLSPYPHWEGRNWLTPRPLPSSLFSEEADGTLRVQGSHKDLWEMGATILVEHQVEMKGKVSLSFMVPDIKQGEDLGMCAYYDEHSYLKFGYAKRKGMCGLLLAEYLLDRYQSEQFIPSSEKGTITLEMQIEGMRRSFSKGGNELFVLKETHYLSSEGLSSGKRFTGAMVGLYVHASVQVSFSGWDYAAGEG